METLDQAEMAEMMGQSSVNVPQMAVESHEDIDSAFQKLGIKMDQL